jgi:hypothetical protein
LCPWQRARSRAGLRRRRCVTSTDTRLPRHPAPALAGSRQRLLLLLLLLLLTARRRLLPAALLLRLLLVWLLVLLMVRLLRVD